MKSVRISGLVGLAKQVRQEVAGPVAPERLVRIRREIGRALGTVEQILRENRARVQDLPAPSRKAYRFLKGLDLKAVVVEESAAASRRAPDSVSFRGLTRHFDELLDRCARAAQPAGPDRVAGDPSAKHGQKAPAPQEELLEQVYETIRSDSANIEEQVRTRDLRPEQLTRRAREIRGWLAYFAQREHFEAYCAAVRRAEPTFRAASPWAAKASCEVLVQFRPLRAMYHVVGRSDRVEVELPTPAISFDEGFLQTVARIAFRQGDDRRVVHEAAGSTAYQKIARALEQLGGIVLQSRGVHHDLDTSFDRVNAAYFGGTMCRPHLTWSRTFAARKFGHYDYAHDTVMVNMALDRRTVPPCAVDFIVYHELLHKQLGVTWRNNRLAAHTPEFARRERQFREYDQAKTVLRKLASER